MTSTLALLLAGGGYAQERSIQSRQHTRATSQQEGSGQESRSGKQTTIRGQIESIRQVDLQTARGSDQHSLVRLQMQDGRMVTVDLGPQRNLDQLELQRGDQIQISGRYGTTAGRRVFMADRLRVNGETLTVQRQGQQREQRGSRQMAQQQRQRGQESVQMTGTVEGFHHLKVRNNRGQQQTHTLAQLQLDNGRTVVANLGPKSRLSRLNLEKGERIRLQGHQGTLDGRSILLVDRFSRMDQSRQTSQTQRGGASGEPFTISGKVQGYQVVSIGAGNRESVLLNLELEDGRSVLIDAGEYDPGELGLKNLNLQDQVTIQARRVNRGNRQILMADKISFQESMGGTFGQQESQSQQSDGQSHKQHHSKQKSK